MLFGAAFADIPTYYCPILPYSQPKIVWPTQTQYCNTSNGGVAEMYDAVGNPSGCVAWMNSAHGGNISSLTEAQLTCQDIGDYHDSLVFHARCINPCSALPYPNNPHCSYCDTLNPANFRRIPALTPTPDPNAPTTAPPSEDPNPVKKRSITETTSAIEKRGPRPKPTTTPPATTAGPDVQGICTPRNTKWPKAVECEPKRCDCNDWYTPLQCPNFTPTSCSAREWFSDPSGEANNYCGHMGFDWPRTIEFTGNHMTVAGLAAYIDNYAHIRMTNSTASARRIINGMRMIAKRGWCNDPTNVATCNLCFGTNLV